MIKVDPQSSQPVSHLSYCPSILFIPSSPQHIPLCTQTIKSQWCFIIYAFSSQYKDKVLHITEYSNTAVP